MHPLIQADALRDRLGEVVICDLRWSLTEPAKGRRTYEDGHIPGAVFVDLDRDLSAPPGENGRHPLPPIGDFSKTLGRLGVTPGDHVVAYDDSAGAIAARLWWMLRSIGHDRSQVLDGGYQAWVEAGHPVEHGSNTPTGAPDYPVPDSYGGVTTLEDLSGRTVVDARSPERYRGEFEPVDPKAGHIPGAINLPHSGNLDAAGMFLSPDLLSNRFEGLGAAPVMSCGSGVTACHNALAMAVASLDMPDVYVGSFSEWSRQDMPVEPGQ